MNVERLARLSLNQETIKQWSLPELAEGCAKAGSDRSACGGRLSRHTA